jgi:hypothetical protein
VIKTAVDEAVADYLARKPGNLKPLVQAVRAFVWEVVPNAKETVNPWGVPTFEAPEPFVYWSVATRHITFGFLRGTSLPDPHGLLEGTGKNFRHVKIRKPEDLERSGLRELVAAAARRGAC